MQRWLISDHAKLSPPCEPSLRPLQTHRQRLRSVSPGSLPRGMHSITVNGPKEMFAYSFAEIPFYREISNQGYIVPKAIKEDKEESFLKLKGVLPK